MCYVSIITQNVDRSSLSRRTDLIVKGLVGKMSGLCLGAALHEIGDMERAVECGCDDFVSKPVNKVELLTRVRGLLGLRLLKKRMAAFIAENDRG